MKYPDDFNTPAFPAGKFVAVSRFMATVSMVLFFVIVCLCGAIFWANKAQDISPFLVSIGANGERWVTVAHDNHITEIPAYYALQESVLNKFVRNWFTIDDNILLNQANWAECTRNSPECKLDNNAYTETCAIYCASSDAVFTNFKEVVVPIYSDLEATEAAIWTVQSVSIKPADSWKFITENGGLWKLDVWVKTGVTSTYFTGYARISYNKSLYPKTMGYYISEFNTYRMN